MPIITRKVLNIETKTKASKHLIKQIKTSLSAVHNYLFHNLTQGKAKALGIYFALTALLEVSAYLYHGVFSLIASRIWIIGGIACAAGVLSYFVKTVILDIREKKLTAVCLLGILLLFLISVIGNLELTEINPDAAQQASAGLASYQTGDFNYTGKAFLGYPNRQYVIAALPAFLFGRSIASLQLGFAFPFFMGLMIFYCGLRKWAGRLKVNTNLSVLPLYALFVFPFISEYFTSFEQAIYPVSFTMLVTGFFLLLLCEPDMVNITGFAWCGCMLSNSYTPALAVLGLLLVFAALAAFTLLFRPKRMQFSVNEAKITAILLFIADAECLIFFLATLIDKRQDRFSQVRTGTETFKLGMKSIFDFLTDKNASFLGMSGMVIILYLVAGLSLRLKLRDLLIAMWTLAVFAAADLMTGYCNYEPAWIMQRAMTVIPVLITGIMLTVYDMLGRKRLCPGPWTVVIIAISFSFTGLFNFRQINQSFLYFNYVQPMKYMFEDLETAVHDSGLNSMSEFNLILYTDNLLFKNPADYCQFLYPNAEVYTPDYGVIPEELDKDLDTFVYGDTELMPEIEAVEELEVTDERYELEFTWYKGRITD